MTVSFVLSISILLQGTAAVLALLIIPLSRKALAWILLSIAFFLMTVRRLISLLTQENIISSDMLVYVDPEWVALGISVLMVAGVYHVRYIFQKRNQAEDKLRGSEDRYALVCQGANDGIWDWDIAANKIYYSPRWKSMLGYEDTDRHIGDQPSSWFERVHTADRDELNNRLTRHLKGQSTHFRHEYRMLHKDGHYLWVANRAMAIWDSDGNPTRLVGSQNDITDRKLVEEQILHEAYHDELTGLPNRASFLELLEQAAEKAEDDSTYLYAVLFLDLDRFKVINNSLGHSIGDRLIVAVADMLRGLERESMKVARLGGDEFIILITNIGDRDEIEQYADEVRIALAQPMELDGYEVQTTVSIGIAFSSIYRDLPEHILRDADTAMYQAKENGKDCYEVFNDTMHDDAVLRLEMESCLRYAIERNELEIHYQPIVSLKTGRLSGFEALLRWNHPEMGLIMPDRFIPIAEETGLIIPIGEWVLRNSCKQVQLWLQEVPEAEGLAVSVNISSLQFSQKDFVARIINILQESGLQGHHLRLEITETALIRNVESAMNIFRQLHKAGVLLYLDDFGTGYSSLSYLVRFPLDGLKIDRSFIQALDSTNERPEIVSAIIDLANKLEIDVVAEGVEGVAQSERLHLLNCEHAQGYYFSKPIPDVQVTGMIADHRFTGR
ncbi:MAG TPA: EAL domain-containing protein [Acidiferrobacteraceae bacterium]|nr:EAL domain-containing protein [Acidiferrobacteraceae bacterium]HEX19542.1 EAL domain-containing protein [Acidiferrobacteraceae bacterium]